VNEEISTMQDSTHTRRKRQRGERGIAMVMVGLLLVPMLVFAAFGVDLASWYARISAIQRAADAAALAGAVWMPNTTAATVAAENSLRSNHMHEDNDPFLRAEIRQGSTSTSLRVTVTDLNADRHFSSIFMSGDATLSRYAEAEYNLPLPLGSPLNYFAGDRSTAETPDPIDDWSVTWPSYYGTRAPQTSAACNVGTASAQGAGRWNGTPPSSFDPAGFSGSVTCGWGVGRTNATGSSTTPPPDYTTRPPTNPTCRVRSSSATHGYWNSGSPPTFSTSGSSTTNCSWPNSTTDFSVLAGRGGAYLANGSPNTAPQARPCRVGYAQADGWWNTTGGWTNTGTPPTGMFTGGSVGQGNRLCTWSAVTLNTPIVVPNPIPTDRNPGFWAMIYGPGQYAANGDAFSAQCTSAFNCGTTQNAQYRSDSNRGEWYVVDIPAGVTGNVAIRVFDAAFNQDWGADYDEGGNPRFTTEYRVYNWPAPSLDFNNRTALSNTQSTNQTDGGCYWAIENQAAFDQEWSTLCNINGVSGPARYLVNVRTSRISGATNAAGNNAYAIEAVLNGDRAATPGPSIYAYRDMVINNNNQCSSGTCNGTFYLAKVDPVYAGRTLVVELYDAGDSTGAGVSTVYPMMPSSTAPRPVVNVPSSECTYTATPEPNTLLSVGDARINSGTRINVTTPTAPDSGDGFCGIRATVGGTRQYNGLWMRIRVQIPADYDCNRTINTPETTANSCWWGIRYQFNGNASDTTTWQARIEGNPLQLTE
jgi:hypothetical protein